MRKLTLQDFQNKLKLIHPKEQLIAINWINGSQDAVVKCKTCNTIYIKKGKYFLDKRKISICKKCYLTHTNIKKETFILPEGYNYIEPYNGMHNKILIRHKCGFIWKITPNNLKLGKGCPKCNRKKSKGEQKIKKWLEKHNIEYETQYKIIINNHHLSVDFYLPFYNLFIEYNGIQHYRPVDYFGGKNAFKSQKRNDDLKRYFLKSKLIEIPYTYFDKIEEILESSTTIPNGSTLQAMVVEVEKLLKGV